MILLKDREYLTQNYVEKFRKDPDIIDPEYAAFDFLRNIDYIMSLDVDERYEINAYYPELRTEEDFLNRYDMPIRGTGKQVKLKPLMIPKGVKYLSNFISKVPLDVILLKGKTGIGGTFLAAKDQRKWVVCMSSRNLVKNKSEVHKNSLGVYAIGHGGATDNDIINYKGNTIFTTWASLERTMLNIDPSEWSLLLDENHELITKGSYQNSHINKVIRLKDKFAHVTLMSATETKHSDYEGLFNGMDILEIIWDEKKVFNIEMVKTGVIVPSLVELLKRVLEDDERPNQHVFINKLDAIIRVVTILEKILGKDLSDKISIVASSSKEYNIDKISRIGKGKYKIEDEKSIKRLNFYTSTSFTGVDIKDDFGDIIMAVHGSIKYTRLDFKFDVPQIIGRIRNPRKDMRIMLLYSTMDSKKTVSLEAFKQGYDDLDKDAIATVQWYNSLSEKAKKNKLNISRVTGMEGVELVDGKASKDYAFFMNKRMSYNRDNYYYSDKGATTKDKIERTYGNDIYIFYKGDKVEISDIIFETNDELHVKKGTSFKLLLKELLDQMDLDGWKKDWWKKDNSDSYNSRVKRANLYANKNTLFLERYPFIKDLITLFSPDQIREIGTTKRALCLAMESKQKIHHFIKLRSKIPLEMGKKYEVKEIKNKLNKALSELGVHKSVSSTYIKKIYPSILRKQIRVDKKVQITEDEYRKIRRENFKLSKNKQIGIETTKDANGDAVEIFKIIKNGRRKNVYILPF